MKGCEEMWIGLYSHPIIHLISLQTPGFIFKTGLRNCDLLLISKLQDIKVN